jgi:Ca2+-dependent lipid-binding protein
MFIKVSQIGRHDASHRSIICCAFLFLGVSILFLTLLGSQKQFVRIEGFSLGKNPLRLLAIRALPDELGSANHFNLEVTFSYRRLPPSVASASVDRNVHFLVYLGLGLKKMANFEFPVYVELRGVQGQIRMRVETIPDPPFLKYVSW